MPVLVYQNTAHVDVAEAIAANLATLEGKQVREMHSNVLGDELENLNKLQVKYRPNIPSGRIRMS